jgi:hypothetical protein
MNAALTIALAKVLADEKATLTPGRYDVNETITLRVSGTVAKSNDSEYTPTTSVPWKTVAALLLEKMGVVREAAAAMLLDACREAIELSRVSEADFGGMTDTLYGKMRDADACEKRVQELVAALPKKTRSGPTKVDCTVEVLAVSPSILEPAPVDQPQLSIAG